MSTAAQTALDEMKLAMASTNDLFNKEVFGKRNSDALQDVYTADARLLPPAAPMVTGHSAIKEFWSHLIHTTNAKSAVLTSLEVFAASDNVVEIGKAVLAIEPAGQAAAEIEVKYVVYWRPEEGRWKWHVDIWNQNS